jgi:outer membrane protein assembly factor BamB
MGLTDLVFIGIKGHALALDRATGHEVWRTKLKGGDFVNVVLQGHDLLATADGEVFCLDPATGHVRWNNELKGLGFGLITVAVSGSSQAPAAREKQRQDETSVGVG